MSIARLCLVLSGGLKLLYAFIYLPLCLLFFPSPFSFNSQVVQHTSFSEVIQHTSYLK